MKILLLDIETAPNLAYVWSLWKTNIGLDQITNSGYVLCWSAKWLGEKTMTFDSIVKSTPRKMMKRLHAMLDEADAVITYNGADFDIPTVNKEFVQLGFLPPAPYKQIDLLRVVRKQFRFPSNKLSFVCEALGLGRKSGHSNFPGFKLWVECMGQNPKAWREMEAYNKQDVVVLEELYNRLLPWIDGHPNRGAHDLQHECPNCGSKRYQRRGVAITTVRRYTRYQCLDCGKWFRDTTCEPGRATTTGYDAR